MRLEAICGHPFEYRSVPGGAYGIARHADDSICAIVIRTAHGHYLSIDHDSGPIPDEVAKELATANQAADLVMRALSLGFTPLNIRFLQV